MGCRAIDRLIPLRISQQHLARRQTPTIYKMLIRPVICYVCYGCEAWAYTHNSEVHKLQMIRNMFMDDWKIFKNNKC
jgi:hypothetical protein